MAQTEKNTISCYCLSNHGKMHCPLTTERKDLENTFNYRLHDEEILEVEIDKSFVCEDKRTSSCKNCPFK